MSDVIASLEAEEAFLGSCILDPIVGPQYTSLVPEVFYLSEHQHVWKACLFLLKAGAALDMVSVSAQLADMGFPTPQSTVAKLLDSVISTANHDLYHGLILDKYHRRKANDFKFRVSSLASDTANPDWAIELQSEFHGLFHAQEGGKGFEFCADFFDEAVEPIQSIPTGIPDLDEVWDGGLAPGNLITVAGRPGMGKSAFACWLSLVIAQRRKGVAFASVEMPRAEVVQRWAGSLLGVEYRSIRARGCHNDDRIEKARNHIRSLPLYVDDRSSTPEAIIANTMALASRTDLGILVIDHLHELIPGSDGAAVDQAAKAVNAFKKLAKRLQIPVVLLAQLNRGVEGRQDKRPCASDIRMFGSVEQTSDLMVGLYRDEFYNPETTVDKAITEVIVMKNRHGRVGTVRLLTDIAKCRYYGEGGHAH